MLLPCEVLDPFAQLYYTPVVAFCSWLHLRKGTHSFQRLLQLFLKALMLHAGEINTFQGNLNWVASREHSLSNPVWNGREEEFLPLCSSGESDSANLDHVAELLVKTGIEPHESLMILVPEAYDNHPHLSKNYPEARPFNISCSGTLSSFSSARSSWVLCLAATTPKLGGAAESMKAVLLNPTHPANAGHKYKNC